MKEDCLVRPQDELRLRSLQGSEAGIHESYQLYICPAGSEDVIVTAGPHPALSGYMKG